MDFEGYNCPAVERCPSFCDGCGRTLGLDRDTVVRGLTRLHCPNMLNSFRSGFLCLGFTASERVTRAVRDGHDPICEHHHHSVRLHPRHSRFFAGLRYPPFMRQLGANQWCYYCGSPFLLEILFVVDTELMISRSGVLVRDGERGTGRLGKRLPLFLVVLPFIEVTCCR
jgi:hypothetical protein